VGVLFPEGQRSLEQSALDRRECCHRRLRQAVLGDE
jgi:hypothetical protein